MTSGRVAAVDIGSTYTKAALFLFDAGRSRLLRWLQTPTTQDDLARGFFEVIGQLLDRPLRGAGGVGGVPVRAGSSAKGGLKIAAVGLVPDLTLKAARTAAYSAGGRVVGSTAYRLDEEALAAVLERQPDIVLLAGGTDGGASAEVLANARLLAASAFDGFVVYAGNASVRAEVRRLFKGPRLRVTDNVMPEVGRLSIRAAHEEIRRLFLDTIASGRGLAPITEFCGRPPLPTPAGVMDAVTALSATSACAGGLCVVDLGGATTDLYSATPNDSVADGVVVKGLEEPAIQRSVEGDLGLRVSAAALLETLAATATTGGGVTGAMREWVTRVSADVARLPAGDEEAHSDAAMAGACIGIALHRHAGRLEPTHTPTGEVWVQTGKDLRGVTRLVISGGWAKHAVAPPNLLPPPPPGHASGGGRTIVLVPSRPRVERDRDYVLPLVGPWAAEAPTEAAAIATNSFEVWQHDE